MKRKEIGDRVLGLRKKDDLTQEAVATALGVVRAAYGKKEQGVTWFSPLELSRLAKLFNVTLDWLIDGKAVGDAPTPALSETEWRLVRLFRRATPQGQSDLLEAAIDASLEE